MVKAFCGRTLASIVTAAVAALVVAPVAHADEQSYIDAVRASGEFTGPFLSTDQQILNAGYQACAMIREGRDPAALAASMAFPIQRVMVEAAQSELCRGAAH